MDNDTYDDRTNIRFLKQEEFNRNIVKRLEELEDFKNKETIEIITIDEGNETERKPFNYKKKNKTIKLDLAASNCSKYSECIIIQFGSLCHTHSNTQSVPKTAS